MLSARCRSLLCCCFCFLLSLLCSAQQDFSIVLLPDTQYYSESYPAIFRQQTQWIADNRTALNIRMVVGEGDIVNLAGSTTQWQNADAAIKILDTAAVPYTLALGNHDYENQSPGGRSAVAFNQWFGPARYADYSWYGGNYNGSNENFYTFFSVDSQQYMVLALEFFPRDAVINWASSIIANNSSSKVIITTHNYLETDGTRIDRCDGPAYSGNNPQTLWEKVIRKHSNIILVVSGHRHDPPTAYRSDLADNGNVVNQIFTNFQTWPSGGSGYLRILKFRPSLNRIEVTTYSPYLDAYLTTSQFQFSLPITNDGNTATLGAVAGKVRNTACQAIAGTSVSTGGVTMQTDSAGRYTLGSLTPNTYSVSAAASSYASQSLNTTVKSGFSEQLNFYLSSATSTCAASSATPSVTICSPADNSSVTSPARVLAAAKSDYSIPYMQLYLDGAKVFQSNGSELDTSLSLPDGKRRLTVQTKDASGAVLKQTIYVTVGSAPPATCQAGTLSSVTICSPANNASAASPVRIIARADSANPISYMQLYVDGVKLATIFAKAIDQSFPMAAGKRRVTVQARESTGNIIKQTIYVDVQ